MYEKRVARAYHFDLAVALAVYTVLLFAAIRYGRPMQEGWLRTLVLATPMIGFGLMIRGFVRHVARIDEYQRIRLLENIAVATAITMAATFTYGFMETAGFEKLSMFSVWIMMGASFAAVCIARKWMDR
jgi:O-antigen/teichoic acid export membrane protein